MKINPQAIAPFGRGFELRMSVRQALDGHVMVESYLRLLKGHGRILTEQLGMDWYHGEGGWPMTYADLVSLESRSRCECRG